MDLKELKKTFKLMFPEKDEYEFDWYNGADSVYILCPVNSGKYSMHYYAAFIDLASEKAIIHLGEYHHEIYTRLHKIFVLTLCTRRESKRYDDELTNLGLHHVYGDTYEIKPRY